MSFSQHWAGSHTSSPQASSAVYRPPSVQLLSSPCSQCPYLPLIWYILWFLHSLGSTQLEPLTPREHLGALFCGGLTPQDPSRVCFQMLGVLVKFPSRTCLHNKGWLNSSGIGQPWGSWRGRFYFCLCWKFIFFTAVKNLNQLQFYRKDKLPHPDNLYPSL